MLRLGLMPVRARGITFLMIEFGFNPICIKDKREFLGVLKLIVKRDATKLKVS